MGSRDSELPPFTWEELVAYAQKENLKPLVFPKAKPRTTIKK